MRNATPKVVISFKPAPMTNITSKEWIAEENRLHALHAAAPDMFAALNLALTALAAVRTGDVAAVHWMDDAEKTMKAAVKKAKGL